MTKITFSREYNVSGELELPRTVGQAVDTLLELLPASEIARIAAMSWNEKLSLQVVLGMWIR